MNINRNNKKEHISSILDNLPNEKLQVIRLFGDGGFRGTAVVRNNKLAGRLEDIKFLESFEPNTREKFLKEAKVLSSINHKNIPKIYDILEHDNMLLFRSEHIEGYSLKEVLDFLKERNMLFPRASAASITLKLMNALNYAHNEVRYEAKKRSIIHCDIKPSNIILSAKGYKRKNYVDDRFIKLLSRNKVEPYIIDFGISKFMGESANEEGTLQYMPPAIIRFSNKDMKISWRLDMYQLILVYHEMLTGRTPYSGMTRKKIIEEKLKYDFHASKGARIPKRIKDFIEKGTRRKNNHSFVSEKECIKEFSKIESAEKLEETWKKYKKPVISTAIIILIVVLSFTSYIVWDYYTQSTDAVIRGIENRNNPTIGQLESAIEKIQKRGFEKKYYFPLLKGEFRNKKTGTPLYPSHIDTKGNWVLVGASDERAGLFTGLLFEYADRYPGLLELAKEYSEPIFESDFDGTSPNRFHYALIPAYKKTKDAKYLNKLINITENLINDFNSRKGMNQCADLSLAPLFLFVYNETGEKHYLDFFEAYVKDFITNNIGDDGYIYEYSTVNATTPYGPVPDEKGGRLVFPIENIPIGQVIFTPGISDEKLKEAASPFSRDFVDSLSALKEIYETTGNPLYKEAFDRSLGYYLSKMPEDYVDYFFISDFNKENSIPKDTLAAVKAIALLKENNNSAYYNKAVALLSKTYFRSEKEKGILSKSIYLESANYVHTDEGNKDRTIMETDAFFLEIKIKK
jgi:serine/threonine protein kinase